MTVESGWRGGAAHSIISTEMTFLIETFVPGLGPWDSAEADTPENAFFAVETLLKECGVMTGTARVTNIDSDKVVWTGRSPWRREAS